VLLLSGGVLTRRASQPTLIGNGNLSLALHDTGVVFRRLPNTFSKVINKNKQELSFNLKLGIQVKITILSSDVLKTYD
jgi:hypothetical protein